jgi:hypothetical protein
MLQKAVNIAAILGLLLAALSFGWNIRAHRETHAEKVTYKISIVRSRPGEASYALQLTVVNAGNTPVYLKAPKLYLGIERQDLDPILFYPCSAEKVPLQPGDSRSYQLPKLTSNLLIAASQQPKGRVWISIESQRKVLLRIEGAELRNYLIQLVIMAERHTLPEPFYD